MRKIAMKRKSKSAESTTKNSEPEENVIETAEDKQDSSDENENGTGKKNKMRKTKSEINYNQDSDNENGTAKKNKMRKSKSEINYNQDSDNENINSEKRSKRKSKKGKKSKTINMDESNGTEEKKDEEDDTYEVEQIIDQKIVKGVKHFLIRWKGYNEESDTWEPESTLDCPDLIAKFLDSGKNKKGKKRGSIPNNKSPKKKISDDTDNDNEKPGEYEVDRILEVHFKKNGKREFLVHWKGYNAADNTWEPEENMSCHDLIEKFMEKVNKARETDIRELRVNRIPTKHFTLSMQQSGRRLSRRNLGKQRAQYQELD